jgi:hypothetical protein
MGRCAGSCLWSLLLLVSMLLIINVGSCFDGRSCCYCYSRSSFLLSCQYFEVVVSIVIVFDG